MPRALMAMKFLNLVSRTSSIPRNRFRELRCNNLDMYRKKLYNQVSIKNIFSFLRIMETYDVILIGLGQ